MGLILRWTLASLLACGAAAAVAGMAPERRMLLDEAIGPSPAAAFHLVQALRAIDRGEDADLLARYLLEAYVEQLEGRPHDGSIRVEAALRRARELPPFEQALGLRRRWNRQLKARLAPRITRTQGAVPAALANLAPAATELAPGYWASGEMRYVVVRAMNTGAVALAVPEFGLLLHGGAGRAPVAGFRCEAEPGRPSVRLLQPGETLQMLCVGAGARDEAAGLLAASSSRRRRLEIESHALEYTREREGLVQALAAPRTAELQRLLDATAEARSDAGANPAESFVRLVSALLRRWLPGLE